MKTAISMAPLTCNDKDDYINIPHFYQIEDLYLLSDCSNSGLIPQESIHGDRVLYDKCSDWDQRQNQHVENEEFLS